MAGYPRILHTEEAMRDGLDMPRIESLDEAKHFLKGPAAYAKASSPWKAPIRSYQRPEAVAAEPRLKQDLKQA